MLMMGIPAAQLDEIKRGTSVAQRRPQQHLARGLEGRICKARWAKLPLSMVFQTMHGATTIRLLAVGGLSSVAVVFKLHSGLEC
jgi:hypothetical protein